MTDTQGVHLTTGLSTEQFNKFKRALKMLVEVTGGKLEVLETLLNPSTLTAPNGNNHDKNGHESAVLKIIRRRLGYSQAEFANLLEVSMQTISRWERGRKPTEDKDHPIQIIKTTIDFSRKLWEVETVMPGHRRLYNDFLTAIVRPIDLTKLLFEASDHSPEEIEEILKINEDRITKAKAYLKDYEFMHLYDKTLVDNYIQALTIPEHPVPAQKIPVSLMRKFIENQVKLAKSFPKYHVALVQLTPKEREILNCNFGIIEGLERRVAWIEAREQIGKDKIWYGLFTKTNTLIDELIKRFDALWFSEKIVEKDEAAVEWLDQKLREMPKN